MIMCTLFHSCCARLIPQDPTEKFFVMPTTADKDHAMNGLPLPQDVRSKTTDFVLTRNILPSPTVCY